MRKVVIIQARMGSSRLPGKVLKTLGDRTVLDHVVTRVKAAKVDQVVVATSDLSGDDAIATYCADHQWSCVRGSETDVLSRYAKAVKESAADIVVRVTSDCPLFSPLILDQMLDRFDPSSMDYKSTNLPARSFPVGLDCEVMRADVLLRAHAKAADAYDREHVTPFIYHNPSDFSLHGHVCDTDLSGIRITLDTTEDYTRLVDLVAARPALLDPQTDVLPIVDAYFAGSRT